MELYCDETRARSSLCCRNPTAIGINPPIIGSLRMYATGFSNVEVTALYGSNRKNNGCNAVLAAMQSLQARL